MSLQMMMISFGVADELNIRRIIRGQESVRHLISGVEIAEHLGFLELRGARTWY